MKTTLALLACATLTYSCMGPLQFKESDAEGLPLRFEKYQGEEPTDPEATEIYEPVPPKVVPGEGSQPPSDAIVLFDGTNLDQWVQKDTLNDLPDGTELKDWERITKGPAEWIINDDGSMTVRNQSGNISTKRSFGSVQLHLEWKSPADTLGIEQARANSGVFLQERYEVQILDNNDNSTYVNGQVASIYKQHIPLAMASRPSGEWNTYDIIFHAPEFTADSLLKKPATLTVFHNGVLVQDHRTLEGVTTYKGWPRYHVHGKAPIMLQDHEDNSRVSFRNIWVREL